MIATLFLLAASLAGQAPENAKADPNLDYMRKNAAAYRFTSNGAKPLKLKADPVFRLGKQPADTLLEGAIFLWIGEDGRPEAAAQFFQFVYESDKLPHWVHEFTSLSTAGFAGEINGQPTWSPRGGGVEFRAIPKAPKPATTAGQRSSQIRALAREFAVTDLFKGVQWTELRLLTTPIARYGKAGSKVEDGALFAFVTGTDPETFLFIEARVGKDGLEWQYAFAPMSCYQLKGTHSGRIVWEIPYRKDPFDPSKPYFAKSE